MGILSLALFSCAKKSEPGTTSLRDEQFNELACDIQPDDGQSALLSNLSANKVVTAPYFDKRYDRADLEAVLGSSGVETALYVQRLGVSLYKAPRSSPDACAFHFGISRAPQRLMDDEWNRAAGRGGGTLLGLYFEDCKTTGTCSDTRLVNPTIMVLESSDRWTLVHEMMHHNFNKQRKLDGMAGDMALLGRMRSLDIQYGERLDGRFSYVDDNSLGRGYRYIVASQENGAALLSSLNPDIRSWETTARHNGWTEEANDAARLLDYVDSVESYTRKIVTEVKTKIQTSTARASSEDPASGDLTTAAIDAGYVALHPPDYTQDPVYREGVRIIESLRRHGRPVTPAE